jgi:hypothetical protein
MRSDHERNDLGIEWKKARMFLFDSTEPATFVRLCSLRPLK